MRRFLFLLIALTAIVGCRARATPAPATPTENDVALRPTFTPVPVLSVATATVAATETASPIPSPTETVTVAATETPVPATPTTTATRPAATATQPPPTNTPPLPATATPTPTPVAPSVPAVRDGGAWDFDGGYTRWQNPYGEPCTGGSLANGWNAFLTEGQFGSSCFNENKFGPNIQSGARSQEITFESIDATSGLWRTFETVPGHRYRVRAWGIWHESPSPVILQLGVDPAGSTDWQAGNVQWNDWGATAPGEWHRATLEFTAQATTATVFLKGSHPVAQTSDAHPLRGGATLFDNVAVTDLDA